MAAMATLALHADDLILFAHIADAGSLTRASDRTGLPKATLSRRLTALENRCGERLLQRSTRRMVLTAFGEQMLEHARRLSEEAGAAAAFAQHRQRTPRGSLRVALPPEFAELSLALAVTRFHARYPDVRLELDLSARRVDLVAERFDLAVRVATRLPDDGTLVARRITTLSGGLYANRNYLRRYGTPRTPDDLIRHVGLALVIGAGERQKWLLSRRGERWEGLPDRVLVANSLGLLHALGVRGLGIVALTERFTRGLANRGELERVLPDWNLPPITLWCVTAGRRLLSPQTHAFIEILRATLADDTSRR